MKKGDGSMIYMDNAATTRLHPEVINAMLPYMGKRYANPSGAYTFSADVKNDINNAEAFLAQTIQAKPQEIYITSGGTESDNWAVKIAAEEHRRGHIITTAMEHHAILKSCEAVEKEGFYVTYIRPAENGIVRLTDIQWAVRPDTFLISVMAANNEIGTIQPVAQIGAFARRHRILFHTDAVHFRGKSFQHGTFIEGFVVAAKFLQATVGNLHQPQFLKAWAGIQITILQVFEKLIAQRKMQCGKGILKQLPGRCGG